MSAYLKIFGSDKYRATENYKIQDELIRSEGYYAACYSERRKPYKFKNDDLIYLARITKKPNDYIVFGKAWVADTFSLPRDKATQSDIDRLSWKNQWPYYLRLKNALFIDGMLRYGIRIEELISYCGVDSFEKTKRWNESGNQNINIKQAFCNQADVELTTTSEVWLHGKFNDALNRYGCINTDFIDSLPKPDIEL